MNNQDLHLIANLLYFSFLRSAVTLEAQEIACRTLETVWQGWQNIAQTRMNPSLKAPYETDYGMQNNLFQDFIQGQYFHRAIGLSYSHCAQAAVKQHLLTDHAQKAVTILREQARTVVANAFLDVKKLLGDLYHFAADHTRDEGVQTDDQNRFDLMATISSYIPGLAMQSFIEAEHINIKAGEQSWQIVNTINQVSKEVWQSIETARASYYLAHYNALISVIQSHGIDQTYLHIMFDENGIIPTDKQYQLLPDIIQEN